MNQQLSVKNALFFLQGSPILEANLHDVALPVLDGLISNSNSTLIVDDSEVSRDYPIFTILGFAKTLSSDFSFEGPANEGSIRSFKNQLAATGTKSASGDEEVIEVRYISHPRKLSEVTDAKVLIVTSSKETAIICEKIEVDYLYTTEQCNFDDVLQQINQKHQELDLLILHREQANKDTKQELQWMEDILKKNCLKYQSLRIIFSDCSINTNVEDLVCRHESQLKTLEKGSQNLIRQIIPKQTWQYYRGVPLLQDTKTLTTGMLMINYREGLNRADDIQTIAEYSNLNVVDKFGGKIVHSAGVFREMLFELGKLPKFGA